MLERLLKAFNLKSRRINGESTDLKIDAELLACPICLDIFANAPSVLPCGHSICCTCLSKLTRRELVVDRTFKCPLCCKPFAKDRRYPKNYTVEAILNSIDEWIEGEMSSETSDKNAERIAVARLKKRVEIALAENTELKLEVDRLKWNRVVQTICFAVLAGCGALLARSLLHLL